MGTPATLPANFSGFDEDKAPSASTAKAPQSLPANFSGFDEDKQPSPAAPPEAQPYTMANGRQIDPMAHTGGIPNPHAVMPNENNDILNDPLGMKQMSPMDRSATGPSLLPPQQPAGPKKTDYGAPVTGWAQQGRPAPKNAYEEEQQHLHPAPVVPAMVEANFENAVPGATPGMQTPEQIAAKRPPLAAIAENPSVSGMDRLKSMPADRAQKAIAFAQENPGQTYVRGVPRGQPMTAEKLANAGITADEYGAARDYLATHSGPGGVMSWHPEEAAQDIGKGWSNIYHSSDMTPEQARAAMTGDKNPALQPRTDWNQAASGLNQAIGGAMEAQKPLMAAAASEAPFKMIAGYLTGVAAGYGSDEMADKYNLSPEMKQLAHTAAFFAPLTLAEWAGLKGGMQDTTARVRDPITGGVKEVPVKAAAAGGKGFGVGVGKGEDGSYYAAGRVGPFSARAKWGGTPEGAPSAPKELTAGPAEPGAPPPPSEQPPAPPPSAVSLQQKAQAQTITEVAASAASIDHQAAQIAGLAPPPPPPPKPGEPGSKQIPPPDGIEQGHISQQVMSDLGTVTTQLPSELQPKFIREVTGNLARVMFDAKTFVGPDMIPVNVDSQKAAQTESIALVKGEIEKRQQEAQEAAKAQQEQQEAQKKIVEQQQKDAEDAAEEREKARQEAEKNQPPPPIPDNPVTQAIRSSLEKLPVNAKKADVMFAARKAGAAVGRLVPEKLASQFYDELVAKRAKQEDAASAGITGEKVNHDQNPIALGRMANDVQQGKTAFLHVQPGTKFKPTGLTKETGFISTKVDKAQDSTFNGVYFHPAEIKSKDVKAAASGEAPLAHLRGLEANWKEGKSPAQEPENQGRAVLADSAEQTQLGNPKPETEVNKAETIAVEPETKPAEVVQSSTANPQVEEKPSVDWSNSESVVRAALDTKNWTPQNATQWDYQRRTNPTVKAFEKANRPKADLSSVKRENPPQVAQPTKMGAVDFSTTNGNGKTTQLKGTEYIFPGFEEYHIAVVKPRGSIAAHDKLGWESFETSTGRRIFGEPHQSSTEQRTIAGTLQQLKAHGKSKLDAAIEQGLKSPTAKSTVTAEEPQSAGLNTYEVEVSKYAGDPHPKMVRVQAENRRHAEQLIAEKHPGMTISSAGRVETAAPETKPVTFKPGDKVSVKQSDGTQKPDEVRIVLPNKKLVLKGQRKPVKVEDVSPAEGLQAQGTDPNDLHRKAVARTIQQNVDAASHSVVLHNSRPVVELNDDAMVMLDKAMKQTAFSNALIVHGTGVDAVIATLRKVADAGLSANAENLRAMASAIDASRTPQGSIILLRDGLSADEKSRAVAEENFHDWQESKGLTKGKNLATAVARMQASPAADLWEKASAELKKGFKYSDAMLPVEIPAWLSAGRQAELGLSTEEAAKVLSEYMKNTADLRKDAKNGENSSGNSNGSTERSSEAGFGQADTDESGPSDNSLQSRRESEETGISSKTVDEPEYLHGGMGAVFSPEALKKAIENAPAPVHELITSAQTEYANVRKSRSLQSGLYDLDSQANADVIRAKRFMESVPGDANDFEAVYHHIEDPALPLTELQQKILDDYIRPLMASTTETVAEMRAAGAETDDTYVHRIVMDRGGFIDRLMAGSKSTGKGNVLKTKVPSQKSRTMMAVENPDGERFVVSIKGNRVTAFVDGKPMDLGGLRNGLSTKLDEISPRLDPIAENILDTQAEIDGTHEAERQRQIESIEKQIERRQRDQGVLSSVKGRVPGQYAAHGVEPSFGKRAALTREIDALEKQLEALRADTAPVSVHETATLKRLNKRLAGLEADRSAILDQVPTEHLADEIWKDKNGQEWKITQATTKEIEAQTDIEYYHNALGSAIINWLAVEKQARAVRFLDKLKSSPDFPTIAVPIAETNSAPEGWKTTQLAQMRSYYFEPHTAEVLDWYNDRLKAGDPGVFSHINDFLVSSIFFNPLLHVPNIANHWFVEKGLSGWLDPRNKVSQFKAGLKAIDAVMHQNDDFLKALDAGGALKSQQFETRKFAETFLDKMQKELEGDPTVGQRIANSLGYANPLKWLEAMKNLSSRITWYSNDIAFLQSAYEKTAHGMDLETALRETAKHIPDYRLPTRIFDSKGLESFLANKNLVMFMNYHYGAVKSYGETIKSVLGIDGQGKGMGSEEPSGTDYSHENEKGEPVNAAGRTREQEQMHGLDILAALGFVTFVLYPLMDQFLKKATGDKNAQVRRAGASTVPYNLIQVAQGEKSPWDAIQSTVTPGVTAKLSLELAMNRDLRTGKQIYSWPPVDAKTEVQQAGEKLVGSFGPAAAVQGAHNYGTAKQLWGMAGVSFPQHGGERIATEIAQAKAGSEALTPDARKRMQAHYAALDALRAGDGQKAREEMNKAGLNAKQQYALRKEADADPLLVRVKAFTLDELKTVYKFSTPEEKMRLGPFMRDKEEKERRKEIGLGLKPKQ